MKESRTVSVYIARSPDAVYSFLAEPSNFPRWSEFIQQIEPDPDGTGWWAQTPAGRVWLRFVPPNAYRVVDHDVTLPNGQIVHVPMRVLPHPEHGAEVIFTVFRQPGMTEAQFQADVAAVQADLGGLRRFLAASHGSAI